MLLKYLFNFCNPVIVGNGFNAFYYFPFSLILHQIDQASLSYIYSIYYVGFDLLLLLLLCCCLLLFFCNYSQELYILTYASCVAIFFLVILNMISRGIVFLALGECFWWGCSTLFWFPL